MSLELPSSPSLLVLEEWKQQLLDSYSSVSDLVQAQLITSLEALKLSHLGEKFKVRITPYYASLFSDSTSCPIRRQALPDLGEVDPELPLWATKLSQEIYLRPTPWSVDAIGDLKNLAAPRLTHRYQNRAILHLSSMCAVYCRFCFRKGHLNDEERSLYEGPLDAAFAYLKISPQIQELILTGGDPLSLSDSTLMRLFERVSQLPHIKVIRIHSRMAVTLPNRFTPDILELFERNWSFKFVIVSHFNHPRELTTEAKNALDCLRRKGVTLLNQSVLLNGINNSVDCLTKLFQGLYESGVVSFYIHHPDWTPGTFQFRVSIASGQELISKLRGRLSGPALPDYILDIPQGYGKISLMGEGVKKLEEMPNTENHLGMQGSLYELGSPETKNGIHLKYRYLDLSPQVIPPFSA